MKHFEQMVYPWTKELKWSKDNYDPVWVPKKGAEIKLNHYNYLLYKDIIVKFEKTKIEEKDNTYYSEGKEIKKYKFSNNYYFMMGDNRYASEDSRRWGFVPKCNIIGKASMVLWSYDIKGFKWNSFF